MTPEQRIDALAFNAVTEALGETEEWLRLTDRQKVARAVLAAVLPEHEKQVREQVAKDIDNAKTSCEKHPMPFPRPSCWICARNGAFNRSANIARGEL